MPDAARVRINEANEETDEAKRDSLPLHHQGWIRNSGKEAKIKRE